MLCIHKCINKLTLVISYYMMFSHNTQIFVKYIIRYVYKHVLFDILILKQILQKQHTYFVKMLQTSFVQTTFYK